METVIDRKTLVTEIFNAITHGVGVVLGVVGLILLVLKANELQSSVALVAYIIYGVSLILLFLFSTLYHSLSFTKAKRVMRIFDHSAIYVLIAGSYTPYCLNAVGGTNGTLMLVVIWVLAILGIVLKCFTIGKHKWLSICLYLGMGWLSLFLIVPLYHAIGLNGLLLLVFGGVSYSVGTIFYSMKKIQFMHVVWHLFVMAGAAFMYFSILLYS
ncbi:hemolysin III family protein [Carnobacteriaceae bacterium zg-ZUI240]|nr:hemolysin III family protein [Carnobacteriaceae bacterium zg-ZUI240]